MKFILLFLVMILFGCSTLQLIKNPDQRKRLIEMPEVQEILEAHNVSQEQLREVFCKQDPVVRLSIRIEGAEILRDEFGIVLPDCSKEKDGL